MNNIKKQDILEKVSYLLDNPYRVNDIIYCINLKELYQYSNTTPYHELTTFAILRQVKPLKLNGLGKNAYCTTNTMGGDYRIHTERFDDAYNIQRNGKFVYNQEQEIAKIKKILETEAGKINEYIARLKDDYDAIDLHSPDGWEEEYIDCLTQNRNLLNDTCTSKVVRDILKESDNTEEQFNLLFNHIDTVTTRFQQNKTYPRYLPTEYCTELYINILYKILNALRCQMLINFDQ